MRSWRPTREEVARRIRATREQMLQEREEFEDRLSEKYKPIFEALDTMWVTAYMEEVYKQWDSETTHTPSRPTPPDEPTVDSLGHPLPKQNLLKKKKG